MHKFEQIYLSPSLTYNLHKLYVLFAISTHLLLPHLYVFIVEHCKNLNEIPKVVIFCLYK